MARINISEFQFVFAFFHKFMSLPENAGKQFIVPSLLQEGGIGAINPDLVGTDLVIEDDYFFQFKMGDRLTTERASEITNTHLQPTFLPYFRFNVKNSPNSHQFNALVALANVKGANKVFYISPLFNYPRNNANDDERAFQDFWRSRPLIAMSKVTWIDFHQWVNNNPLTHELNDSHVICCNLDSVTAGTGYLFSEPKEIKIGKFISEILSPKSPKPSFFYIDEIVEILNENSKDGFFWRKEIAQMYKSGKTSLEAIKKLQNILLVEFNVCWMPSIKKVN